MDTEEKPKHAGGRPSAYQPEYCEIALEVLGAGGSRAALAARLDISKSNLCDWEKKYPEFSNALARGLARSEALWESPDFYPDLNALRWKMNMMNRFGWTDKSESKVENTGFTLVQNLAGPKE